MHLCARDCESPPSPSLSPVPCLPLSLSPSVPLSALSLSLPVPLHVSLSLSSPARITPSLLDSSVSSSERPLPAALSSLHHSPPSHSASFFTPLFVHPLLPPSLHPSPLSLSLSLFSFFMASVPQSLPLPLHLSLSSSSQFCLGRAHPHPSPLRLLMRRGAFEVAGAGVGELPEGGGGGSCCQGPNEAPSVPLPPRS